MDRPENRFLKASRHIDRMKNSVTSLIFALAATVGPVCAVDEYQVSQGAIYDALMGKPMHVKYTGGFEENQSLTMDRGVKGSQKPLGVIAGPKRIEFNTAYIDVDAKTVSAFAEGLHSYIVLKRGGWEGFQKADSRPLMTTPEGEAIHPFPDAFKASHVSYDDMLIYARDWWRENIKYKNESGPLKDKFLYEAILDAIRNYDLVELWTGPKPSTDQLQWCDVVLRDAADKK